MLRIAICDDDKKLLTLLHKEIDLWFLMLRKTDYNFSIDEYTSSEQFSFCLKSNSYDIIFLDIEMPKLNGIELAKQIRSKLRVSIFSNSATAAESASFSCSRILSFERYLKAFTL